MSLFPDILETKLNKLTEKIIVKVIDNVNITFFVELIVFHFCCDCVIKVIIMLIFAAARCLGLYYVAVCICVVATSYTVQPREGLNVALLQMFVLDCAGVHDLCMEKWRRAVQRKLLSAFHIIFSTHTAAAVGLNPEA